MEEAFLPFIRADRYGEGGWAPQPLWERCRLLLLAVTLLPLRSLLCLLCITSYYLIVRIATIIPHETLVTRIVTYWGKIWSRTCLFCLGFVYINWVKVAGSSNAAHKPKQRPVAVVSNHCSWADILIHMARYFPAFVARDETQSLPMIGLISQRMQCLYVNREKKNGVPQGSITAASVSAVEDGVSSKSSSQSLPPSVTLDNSSQTSIVPEAGGVSGAVSHRMLLTAEHPEMELRPMLLFPEGTTTNGRYLLPFKTGAFLAGVPVLPTIIHYNTAAGSSSATRLIAAAAVAAAVVVAVQTTATLISASPGSIAAAAAGAIAVGCAMLAGVLSGRGGVSPCWESINATRHLLLMMCQPFHTVTCYELPLYTPGLKEQADPRLYADNVRHYMLQHSIHIAASQAAAARWQGQCQLQISSIARPDSTDTVALNPGLPYCPLLPSSGLLAHKRKYQAGLRHRRQQVEDGKGLTFHPRNVAGSKQQRKQQ